MHGGVAYSPGLTMSVIWFQTGFQINVVRPGTYNSSVHCACKKSSSIRKIKLLRKFITATEQNLLLLLSFFKNT